MQQHSPSSNSGSAKSEDSGVGGEEVARKTSAAVRTNFRSEIQLFREEASCPGVPLGCLSPESRQYLSNWNR